MEANLLPYILEKLDRIREHQIKEGEAMAEVRMLLKTAPSHMKEQKSSFPSLLKSWLELLQPLGAMMIRHAITVLLVIYMVKEGGSAFSIAELLLKLL